LDENILWIGTDDGNIQVTKDGGENWINVTTNLVGIPANTWVYHIEASVHGKGTAYAVFEGHTTGDMKPYSLKTIDYGQTWTNIITDGVHGFVRNIQEDYESENLLFLGTEFGLYVTIDGGKNWSKFENNMPATAVHFMELQKQTNDLVMGTHGRGVIIIDDISPLRELGQEVLAKDVYFFKTKPFIMTEDSGFSGSFGAETQFVGQSKSSAARIVYYLKKRHTFGKMKMEVFDMDGNKITDLNPEKSKGINVVTWGFNKKVPKMAQGKTLSFAGFTSPRIPAGSYKVILTKGKKTYEHVIEVNYDKNSITTLAERKEQEALTETLFNMVEDLAYMVYEINITMDKAKEVIKNDFKGKKKAQQTYNALNYLLKELVVTTGDSYVASAAPELREKMGDLYSNIASTYDRVSGANRDNFELISEEFDTAKSKYKEIQNKEVKKFNSYLVKSGKELTKLKSKKDFLEK
jgi:peptide methionine sulfoxide reductase MsrA